jgi:hypothetical protein
VNVRVIDPALNRDAVGAEVAVRAGGVRLVRVANPAESYLSAGPGTAHFGLGGAAAIDGFDVTWPDGTKETFPGGAADRPVELRKGSGTKQ